MSFIPGDYRIRDRSGNISADEDSDIYSTEAALKAAIHEFVEEGIRYSDITIEDLDICVERVEIHEVRIEELAKFSIEID